VEGSPERRPLFHFSEMISWLESQDLLPNNWKANLTEPLVASAISPLAIGLEDGESASLVALAVLAVRKKDDTADWQNLRADKKDVRAALSQFFAPLTPDVLSHDQLNGIIANIPAGSDDELETLVSGLMKLDENSYGDATRIIIEQLFGKAGRGSLGFYTTSTTVSQLLINAASTTAADGDIVFDPTCGTSTALLGAGARISGSTVIGNDVSQNAVTLSTLRAYLEEVPATFTTSDILMEDPHLNLRADTIVSEPPFGLRPGPGSFRSVEALLGLSIPPVMSADPAFLAYMVAHLSERGRSYVLTRPHLCYSEGLDEFRRQLVARGIVEAIIQLPEKLLNTTSTSTVLWVLRAPDSSKANDPVLLADASDSQAPEEHVAEWLEAMRQGKETTIPTGSITLVDMITEGSNLLPSHVFKESLSADEASEHFHTSWENLEETLQSIGALMPTNKPALDSLSKSVELLPISKLEAVTRVHSRAYSRGEREPNSQSILARMISLREGGAPGEAFANTEDSILRSGDILIPHMASKPAWVFSGAEGNWVAPSSIHVFRIEDSSILPEYLVACVNASFNESDDGSKAPRRKMSEIKIPQLDVSEQKKIVDLTESLAELSEQAKNLESQSQSAMDAAMNLLYFGADM
jgi:type I restriction-modification system DNA methylase subunit